MRKVRKKDPICAYYGLLDLPDPEELCSICRCDIWPGEAVSWDKNGEICHAECVEKENYDYGRKIHYRGARK